MNISGEALYWSREGPRQALYESLYAIFVPERGKADTPEGEMVRCVSRLYRDLYNNGGCNFDVLAEDYHILRDLLTDPRAVERLDILFEKRDTLTNQVADQLVGDCLDQAERMIRDRLNKSTDY